MGSQDITALVSATGALAFVSCAISLAGIFLIIYLKGYGQFIYRLTLHLSVASFFRSLSVGASVIPVNVELYDDNSYNKSYYRNGTEGLCKFFASARQYTYLWSTAAIVWACLYVLVAGCSASKIKTPFKYKEFGSRAENTFREHRTEIIGHLTAVLVPALVFWIPFTQNAYGLYGGSPWCWISGTSTDDKTNEIVVLFYRIVFRIPAVIMAIVCVVMLIYIFCRYSRNARLEDNVMKMNAVRKVAPIIIYPIIFTIVSIASIVQSIEGYINHDKVANYLDMSFITLAYIYDISIPLSLFLHKDFRMSVYHRCSRGAAVEDYDVYVSFPVDQKDVHIDAVVHD